MMTTLRIRALDARTWAQAADWLAVGVAVALPWSTSASSVLIALWLLTVLPTLDAAAVKRALTSAAGGLPVLLCVLAAVGMLWADASWHERLGGLDGFVKVSVIPLLLAHFRRSEHGVWVLFGFFVSVLAVLLCSWALVIVPGLRSHGKEFGVPVRDYIIQSECFLICAFVLLRRAFDVGLTKGSLLSVALVALALVFLANIAFVVTGRTALLVAPVLLFVLSWQQFGWKGVLGGALLGCVIGVVVWFSSPYLHARIEASIGDLQSYGSGRAMTSTALHLDFMRKSLSFVATAPLIGHGTGSIPEQFRNAAVGQSGVSSVASVNPHDQILAVAVQLGLVGTAVLVAMWIAHLMLFRGGGFIDWVGMVVVLQNVVASLVNSHLFDFAQGWLYVFGVGVAGGVVLRQRDAMAPARRTAKP
jgi:hypothetical protein